MPVDPSSLPSPARVLILGGTAWLGGEIARFAVAEGHRVTCLARGDSGLVPDGAELVRGDRTRPDAYAGLEALLPDGGHWDLVVDVSRQPGQVRGALAALAHRAEHWAFVSTGSVYADHSTPGAGVDAPTMAALDGDVASPDEYGPGKVAAEEACRAALGDRLLVARSGLIAGYGDPSDRVGYWPGRFALARGDGGPVVVPEDLAAPAQFLDVRDLAAWLVRAGLGGVSGTVDTYGPRRTLGDVLDAAAAVAGFVGERVAVSDERLRAAGVEEFMGPRSLPLWLPDPAYAGFMARDPDPAAGLGLRARDLTETLTSALAWEEELGLARTGRSAGLDRADELALLTVR